MNRSKKKKNRHGPDMLWSGPCLYFFFFLTLLGSCGPPQVQVINVEEEEEGEEDKQKQEEEETWYWHNWGLVGFLVGVIKMEDKSLASPAWSSGHGRVPSRAC